LISRNDIRLVNAVIVGLQESNYRFYVERKLNKEQFLEALKYGYIALKWQLRNGGLADLLKNEFRKLKDDVPDWWKWHFGWQKDYDVTEYDTGDPLELAEKILLASKHGIPFKKVRYLYDIAYTWAFVDDEDLKDDREYVLKLVKFIQILSWADYEFPEFDVLKEFAIELIEKKYSNDEDFKWIVYGDKEVLNKVSVLYDKPYVWLLWKDVVGE